MKKNNYLIISSKYRPDLDGLSDHTYHLYHNLKQCQTCSLLTSDKYQSDDPNIFSLINRWNFSSLKRSYQRIASENQFTHIIIQYVPSMYAARGGINFSILLFFIYLRFFSNSKIIFIFHELFYPFSFYWKNIILNICHKIMLTVSLNTSHHVFCSTDFFTKTAKKFLFSHKRIERIPISSNIITDTQPEFDNSMRIKNKFLIFGSPHPSKHFTEIFKALDLAYKEGAKFELTILGPSLNKLNSQCIIPEDFQKYTTIIPNASEEQVIKEFLSSSFLIAFFVDGISTRRSSVISALAYGVNIISNMTYKSDLIFKDKDFIKILPPDIYLFQKELVKLIKSKPVPTDYKNVLKFYENNCSWSLVLEKLKGI